MKVRPVSGCVGRDPEGSSNTSLWRNEQHINVQVRALWFQPEIGAVIGDAGIREARKEGSVTPMNPVTGTGDFAPDIGAVDGIVLTTCPEPRHTVVPPLR